MMNKVKDTISHFNMLEDGEKVLVGLSGGADSVALLLVLKDLGFDVCACHINHQLRGQESERDQKFCEELCKCENIRLYVERIDVITYCKENKVGTEEGARVLRYNALQKIAKGIKIVTAHNLNDRLETTLINLTRGTALRGLCSIPPVRDNIVRPLIDCTRAEIEDYLKDKGQDFVTDSTNLSTDYTRNKMRHIVIPELIKINPNLYNNFKNTVDTISDEDKFLEKLCAKALDKGKINKNEYDCGTLLSEDLVILKRCIAKILKDNNLECSNKKITQIVKIMRIGGKINLSGDVYAISKTGRICICTIINKKSNFEVEAQIGKEYKICGKKTKYYEQNINDVKNKINVNKKFANRYVDYDKIKGTVLFRNRRNGDSIKFYGKPFTTNIKKLFNRDIPLGKRDDVIFLADDIGVIYVEGYGVSERVCVDKNTKVALYVEIREGTINNG